MLGSTISRLTVTVTFMALIGVLSLTPDRADPGDSAFIWLVHTTPSLLQKLLHVCTYGMLAASWAWTLRASRVGWMIVAMVVAAGFGAAMEWLQTFVPGRFGTAYDVLLNGAGALAGLVVFGALRRRP